MFLALPKLTACFHTVSPENFHTLALLEPLLFPTAPSAARLAVVRDADSTDDFSCSVSVSHQPHAQLATVEMAWSLLLQVPRPFTGASFV